MAEFRLYRSSYTRKVLEAIKRALRQSVTIRSADTMMESASFAASMALAAVPIPPPEASDLLSPGTFATAGVRATGRNRLASSSNSFTSRWQA